MPDCVEPHRLGTCPSRRGKVAGTRTLLLAGRLCRSLMVLVLCLVAVFMAMALCITLLQQVPAFRPRGQLTAAQQKQQRQRQELSRQSVRFAPDGKLFLDLSEYEANRRTVYDAESRQLWQGKYVQAPPYEFIGLAWTPPRLENVGVVCGGRSWDQKPFPLAFGRRPTFFLPGGTQPADARRPASTAWRYNPYKQVWERYDSDGRCLGALGAAGFAADPAAAVPLGRVLVGFGEDDLPFRGPITRAFWITTNRVYLLDFAAPAAEIALDGEPLRQLSVSIDSQTTRVRCQVITAEGVHHLWLAGPREYRRLAIHTADGKPLLGEAGVDSQGQLYLEQIRKPMWGIPLPEDLDARCSAVLYRVSAGGLAEEVNRHTWDIPVSEPRGPPSFALSEWPKALFPALLYAIPSRWAKEQPNLSAGGPAANTLRELVRQPVPELRFASLADTLLVSAAWLLLGVGLARRRGQGWAAIGLWLPVVLALNLAGLLTWRLCAEGTARRCAACGHRTAADRRSCHRCGHDPAAQQELLIGARSSQLDLETLQNG